MAHVYLVTGATRGLGKEFVQTYLNRPDSIVIAAVRDIKGSTAKALEALPKGKNSRLILVKIDSQVEGDPAVAVKAIEAEGITHLDTVIANAGISDDYSSVTKVSIDAFRRHMDTNAYGTLFLIQAVYPLLAKSKKPIFAVVGSAMGTIGGMELRAAYPAAGYGSSKAVVNWLTRKLHFENPELTALVLEPGFVSTDMGNSAASLFGIPPPPVTTKDSVAGMISILDNATREKVGGRCCVWDGTEFPW